MKVKILYKQAEFFAVPVSFGGFDYIFRQLCFSTF